MPRPVKSLGATVLVLNLKSNREIHLGFCQRKMCTFYICLSNAFTEVNVFKENILTLAKLLFCYSLNTFIEMPNSVCSLVTI